MDTPYYECSVCNLVSANKPCPVCVKLPVVVDRTSLFGDILTIPRCCSHCGKQLNHKTLSGVFLEDYLRNSATIINMHGDYLDYDYLCIPCAKELNISFEWEEHKK